MRVKIHNYDDIEKITEISEEKISVLYISMSYFILFSIFIILLWTYFGKIDLRIKASGTIETKTESSIIINLAAGK